ncbi:MAG: 17 kDa surface antigen [Polaromonas sp.]|nr:17 kDa surface antigen [Polaromonas sp.]
MKKALLLTAAAGATSLLSFHASAADILARVISSTPVVQQVAVPRQVCNNQQVLMEAPRSGGGALLGAVAGGAVGNAVGNGSGRALATVVGLVGGAMIGDRVEGSNTQVQNVQQCSTQTFYENRPSHFNVVYEYQGTQYSTQMVNDPGQYVRLQVTPVGAINSQPQPGFQQNGAQPGQPQAFVQQAPQTTYVQPAAAPVIYQSGPVYYPAPYYARPYYAPYYPPIGLSLNFGYSRGGHRHWR